MANSEQLEVIFDRTLLRKNRVRYAKNHADFNFLYVEVANKIIESLNFMKRDFDSVLEIGARDGYLSQQLLSNKKAKHVTQTEICDFGSNTNRVMADDEYLPFKPNSFDLIVSCLNFQHINLVPQFLIQVRELLKEDGIFIASFFGEENLSELAHVMFETETQLYGGVSPRIPPTIDVKSAAHLLQKAGFKSPISDFEKIEVNYQQPLSLIKDVKMMGQGNVMHKRSRRFVTKAFLDKVIENYFDKYLDPEGGVTATFEVVTATGWK